MNVEEIRKASKSATMIFSVYSQPYKSVPNVHKEIEELKEVIVDAILTYYSIPEYLK